ncbi:50S ribosomal protein L6 [Ignicoccus pacificus DSM 13166]|uniref:Large ribosomal subunit protein uL6 n=1 Tax=Ignicoccus pacificus DSM 13166 TaxID=940294 RepID=A0A977PKC7_9CREN|nr:50S ribosomal protein L6 [Ignicoccus pacificus DSM 13166]
MARTVWVHATVNIPENVTVEIEGSKVKVSGPKGTLERDFSHAKGIRIRTIEDEEGKKVLVETFFANRKRKALVNTIAAHIENMITGVTKGWRYKMKIVFSHFPINVKVVGDTVEIHNFIGEKAPRKAKILPGVKVQVKGKELVIEGIDLEKVAQTAANIEQATKIKDFDRRVFMDGIYIYQREVAA